MSIKGIDVSEMNKSIDWEKVKNDGIKFAILRCGYGMDITKQDDTRFEKNMTECERLNIPYGVYLFSYANTVAKAKSEAQHTLRLVKGHNPSLGIWYDIENKNTFGAVGKETLTNIITTYCNTIKNAGFRCGVYANLNWLNNKIETQIKSNYPIWVAQYNNKCEYKGKYDIWQYSSKGKVDGIATNVDMDYLYNEKLIDTNSNNDNNNNTDNVEKTRIKELQTALNKDFKAGLAVDGIIGPATTKVVMQHYLKYYTKGNFVKWTQKQLKRKGYKLGVFGLDGRYGKQTQKAVKSFQINNNLTPDGCVGIATVKKLVK